MSRTLAKGLSALFSVMLLALCWGRLSHWLETNLQVDATVAFTTMLALLAVCAALTVRFVRERL